MKIAIIGTGISGLTAAWLLHKQHELTLFEAGDHVGGHTNTVPVSLSGRSWSVDTGFIVYNQRTYPNFCRILEQLGVAGRDSTMSFSVRDQESGLEWNGSSLATVFAQRRNLLRPAFWGMLRDILRFAGHAERLAGEEPAPGVVEESLDAFLDRHRFGAGFRRWYLTPMTSAIWSMPPRDIGGFPVRFLCRFLHNHGMLRVRGRPQWRTVLGGSASYVTAMIAPFRERIRLHAPVQRIERPAHGGAIVHSAHAGSELFDTVIMACHADQALRLLATPSLAENAVLSDLPYTSTTAILHTDERVLPRSQRTRAAWNAVIPAGDGGIRAALTYDMNTLQGLQAPVRFLVSLGCDEMIDPASILRRIPYQHPAYSLRSHAAQQRWAEISGVDRIHYCGAYWGWGFHEDGVVSGVRVATRLGATW